MLSSHDNNKLVIIKKAVFLIITGIPLRPENSAGLSPKIPKILFTAHGRPVCYRVTASSLLMAARRGVWATRAVGLRTAPDALVAARAMSMQSVWTIRASVSVARRAAPFAVLLVVAMLVKTARAVRTPVSVACRTAMSAFCRHASFPFAEYYSTNSVGPAPKDSPQVP